MKQISVVIPLGIGREFDVAQSIEEHKEQIDFIIERGNNTSRNRNNGARKSKKEYIAFINGHTLLSPDWKDSVLQFFKKYPEVDVVGGPQLTSRNENLFGYVSGIALSSRFGSGGIFKRYSPGKLTLDADETSLTSANLICRKKVLESVSFDESLYPGEDPKFIDDCKKTGFRVAYTPDIKVYNKRRGNAESLAKQIFSYGNTRPKKERLFESLLRPYFLVPSLFVLYLIFFGLLSLIIHPLFVTPLIIYLFLSMGFSIFEGIKNRSLSAIILLPFVFFVIHISYGLGFLHGLFFDSKPSSKAQ